MIETAPGIRLGADIGGTRSTCTEPQKNQERLLNGKLRLPIKQRGGCRTSVDIAAASPSHPHGTAHLGQFETTGYVCCYSPLR